jgi:hypothetical protein
MPYPHVTQFETLDRRRHLVVDGAEVPSPAAVLLACARRVVARLGRLGRTPRCASGAV